LWEAFVFIFSSKKRKATIVLAALMLESAGRRVVNRQSDFSTL
jgi:hypothetical protein